MTWRITFDRGTAFVEGPRTESRRHIAACGDHSPSWVQRRTAWATSPAVASAVLDQLEARNVSAVVEHADQGSLDLSQTVPANVLPDRPAGLW